MSYQTVTWAVEDGVGRITLNRPDTLNAWNEQFGLDLRQVITEDAQDDSVRSVLITGAGRAFSPAPTSSSRAPASSTATACRMCASA